MGLNVRAKNEDNQIAMSFKRYKTINKSKRFFKLFKDASKFIYFKNFSSLRVEITLESSTVDSHSFYIIVYDSQINKSVIYTFYKFFEIDCIEKKLKKILLAIDTDDFDKCNTAFKEQENKCQ